MPEGDPLAWLPENPPPNGRIRKAWSEMYDWAFDHVYGQVTNKRIRKLLSKTSSANLNVSLLPLSDISEWDNTSWPDDERPRFSHADDEEQSWSAEDEGDQGNLMERGESIRASEEFGIYMSFQLREIIIPHDIAQLYSYRRLTVHPDTALHVIQSINRDSRRTIADALVHKFIRANHRMEIDEEYFDGGVSAEWRDIENDPSLDALRFGNIHALYRAMVQGKKKRR